jgi:hypothetical protein
MAIAFPLRVLRLIIVGIGGWRRGEVLLCLLLKRYCMLLLLLLLVMIMITCSFFDSIIQQYAACRKKSVQEIRIGLRSKLLRDVSVVLASLF